MTMYFYALFGIQAVLMVVDEFYFHLKRDLPPWERRGHPVDTLLFFLALSSIWWWGTGPVSIFLSLLNVLLITKDEWVHAKLCSAGEAWVHAVLFIIHPVILILAHLTRGEWGFEVLSLVFGFFIYQTVYWNLYAKRIVEG